MGRYGGTTHFKYLADGDGFPTGTKYDYWRYSGYSPNYLLQNLNIRTLAQETVENPSYYQVSAGRYIPRQFNTSIWQDVRTNAPVRGKTNYLPLKPDEAASVYWKLRGFNVRLNQGVIVESEMGGSARVTPPIINDNEFGDIGQPKNRVWSSDNKFVSFFTDRDDFSKVWEVDEYGNEYTVSGIVDYETKFYPSWTRLARYPPARSGADFGFETLYHATYSASCGKSSQHTWNIGTRNSVKQIFIGSQFEFPEDNIREGEEFRELETFKMHTIEFDGIPLLVLERELIEDRFAFYKTAKRFTVTVEDIRLFAFKGISS